MGIHIHRNVNTVNYKIDEGIESPLFKIVRITLWTFQESQLIQMVGLIWTWYYRVEFREEIPNYPGHVL